MRRVLLLGGTAWLGREIATRLLTEDDEVTCLARGSASPPAGARLVGVDRRGPDAYSPVAEHEWDEVVELSYDLDLVTGALGALADRARHWTLVSSVSVYADTATPGADESAEVLAPTDLTNYGQAKVAAERACAQALADRLLVVRPGLIAGRGDGSDRFGYWVSRLALAREGPVLTPVVEGRSVQVVDVEDLARWIVSAGRRGLRGTIDATGDRHALAEVIALAAEVSGFRGNLVPASDGWLLDNDVRHWAGPRSLPLWLPPSHAGFARRDNGAYRRAGGTLSALGDTLARTLDDERARGLGRARRSGLTRAEELDLLVRLAR